MFRKYTCTDCVLCLSDMPEFFTGWIDGAFVTRRAFKNFTYQAYNKRCIIIFAYDVEPSWYWHVATRRAQLSQLLLSPPVSIHYHVSPTSKQSQGTPFNSLRDIEIERLLLWDLIKKVNTRRPGYSFASASRLSIGRGLWPWTTVVRQWRCHSVARTFHFQFPRSFDVHRSDLSMKFVHSIQCNRK